LLIKRIYLGQFFLGQRYLIAMYIEHRAPIMVVSDLLPRDLVLGKVEGDARHDGVE
jgi:hypothetical protein